VIKIDERGETGMVNGPSTSVIDNIMTQLDALTPKGRILGNYILQHPRKAVFMTTKELAETTQVSEATVVRFVGQLGYEGYGDFLQALRDHVDTGMSLPDRVELSGMAGPVDDRFHRIVLEEMNNLRQLYQLIDVEALSAFVDQIQANASVCVVGSRISYTFAYYLGWSLTKVRKGVTLIKGSDSTAIDWLNNAPAESLVILFTISRYPNELIKLGKAARRLGHTLLLISDSKLCPLIPFAHGHLVAPTQSIPLVGYATAISCIVDYIVQELAGRDGQELKAHQERLEQIYRENDILFDMHTVSLG
jgi:DNA-binding MurR/RpiR family transcriptional regulator